jgi:hypothetical protein
MRCVRGLSERLGEFSKEGVKFSCVLPPPLTCYFWLYGLNALVA